MGDKVRANSYDLESLRKVIGVCYGFSIVAENFRMSLRREEGGNKGDLARVYIERLEAMRARFPKKVCGLIEGCCNDSSELEQKAKELIR